MQSRNSLQLPRARVGSIVVAAVLAATFSGGVTAPPAGAEVPAARIAAGTGTITYILNHNVYVASQDGTSPRQVTTDGTAASPWYSPTQSDDGHVVAGRGNLIHRMDQWGNVLNTIDPPDLRSGGGETLGGAPSHLAVSPDGATVAYTYVKNYCSFPNNICKNWPVTGFTSSKSLTPPDTFGTSYGDTPSWVTNSRLVMDSRGPFDNIYLYDLGKGTVGNYWFGDENLHPTGYTNIADIEVSRGTTYAIGVGGNDQSLIYFLDLGSVGDFRAGTPVSPEGGNGLCATSPVVGMSSPTWSADGATAAWQEAGSISMAAMGSAPCKSEPVVVVQGGTSPSFSPAALQTVRPDVTRGSFEVKSKPKITGPAKVGRKLKARGITLAPKPTKVAYQWLRDKKAIKRATKSAYRVTRADRGHKLRVRITAVRPGFTDKVLVSTPVRVKR